MRSQIFGRSSLVAMGFLTIFASSNLILFQMPSAQAADEVHDEIQVYNAAIAAVGQWTYEQHLNYAAIGQTAPEVPGGFHSNHALQGTPEFAYGLTEWWEAGFYLPFAVNGDNQFLSDGAKIRSLFVVPDAAKRSFFYGVNFELGYELPRFSATPWNLEIRPIIGVRNSEWESTPSSVSAPREKRILRPQSGSPATSARTGSLVSNTILTSAKSATSCLFKSKASSYLPSRTSSWTNGTSNLVQATASRPARIDSYSKQS